MFSGEDDDPYYVPTARAAELWEQIIGSRDNIDHQILDMDKKLNVVLKKHEYEYL